MKLWFLPFVREGLMPDAEAGTRASAAIGRERTYADAVDRDLEFSAGVDLLRGDEELALECALLPLRTHDGSAARVGIGAGRGQSRPGGGGARRLGDADAEGDRRERDRSEMDPAGGHHLS